MAMRERILIGAALVIGCLDLGMSGSSIAFNSYFMAVKKTFGYTQSQTELLAAVSFLGVTMAFPAGVLWERYGGRVTSLVGLVLTTISCLLIYSTTFNKSYYSGEKGAVLQTFYFFLAGFGASFLLMAGLLTNIANFSPGHRGKVVGFLKSWVSAGPAIISFVYGLFFVQGHLTDEQNQDLKGFYLMLTVTFFVVSMLGAVFLRVYRDPEVDTLSASSSNTCLTIDEGRSVEKKNYGIIDDRAYLLDDVKDESVAGWKMLLRSDFHFLTWSFIISCSVSTATQANITTILKSAHLESYSTLLTTMTFTTATVSTLGFGVLSDVTRRRLPRVFYLLVCAIGQTAMLILYAITVDNLPVQIIGTLCLSIAIGPEWSQTPVILSDMFGLRNLGPTWGAMTLVAGIVVLPAQSLFGALYENAIDEPGRKDCYGTHCFRLTMIIYAAFSLGSCVMYALLLKMHLRDMRNKRQDNGKVKQMMSQEVIKLPKTGYSGDVSSSSG